MSPRPKADGSSNYISRADLLKQVAQLTKQIERQRKALAETKLTAAPPQPDPDDDSLPEVPEEGLPFRGKATQNGNLSSNGSATYARSSRSVSAKQSEPATTITIRPTPYVRSLFAKQRRGLGGFQSLHAALQKRMGGSREFSLTPTDFARVVNYATNYGEGGFQQSLRWLVALWVADNVDKLTATDQF